MRALVADDDRGTALLLSATLSREGFRAEALFDGQRAWDALSTTGEPTLAIIDWMMPGIDGVEICRRVRAVDMLPVYIILLTARDSAHDIVAGFEAGADDYLVKPFDPNELRVRAHVGRRMLSLQQRLGEQVLELQVALARMKRLRGLLPICCYCKRIRSDDDYWHQVEGYLAEHADMTFSHGICPQCFDRVDRELGATETDRGITTPHDDTGR